MWRPGGKGGQGPKGRHYRKNIILRIRGSDLTHKLEVNGKTDPPLPIQGKEKYV